MSDKIKCPHCNHEYSFEDMCQAQNDLWGIAPKEEIKKSK